MEPDICKRLEEGRTYTICYYVSLCIRNWWKKLERKRPDRAIILDTSAEPSAASIPFSLASTLLSPPGKVVRWKYLPICQVGRLKLLLARVPNLTPYRISVVTIHIRLRPIINFLKSQDLLILRFTVICFGLKTWDLCSQSLVFLLSYSWQNLETFFLEIFVS